MKFIEYNKQEVLKDYTRKRKNDPLSYSPCRAINFWGRWLFFSLWYWTYFQWLFYCCDYYGFKLRDWEDSCRFVALSKFQTMFSGAKNLLAGGYCYSVLDNILGYIWFPVSGTS